MYQIKNMAQYFSFDQNIARFQDLSLKQCAFNVYLRNVLISSNIIGNKF